VKVRENTEPMVGGYIQGSDINQDPSGNINKESGTLESQRNSAIHPLLSNQILAITKITDYLEP